MRWLGCLVIAACYAPTIAERVPCGDGEVCPSGQTCHAGRCYVTPPEVDAPEIDSAPAIDAPPPDGAFTCAGVDSVLNSPCVGTFSDAGFFFDVEAQQSIGITGFSTMTQGAGTRSVSIYYRPGTHVGFEGSATGWTLLGTANNFTPTAAASCPIPTTLIPITFCVEVAKGQRAAFYITMPSGTGTFEGVDAIEGTVVVENADLKLFAGKLQDSPGLFNGAVTLNKAFQGVIHTSR